MKTIQTNVEFKKLESTVISVRETTYWTKHTYTGKYDLMALIPACNTAKTLIKTLDSLVGVVQAVILLDDGSCDDTLQIAKSHELVVEILCKPIKELKDWNDARNRLELHLAAEKYEPKWVMCIDSDEVLDLRFRLYMQQLADHYPAIKAFAFHVIDVDGDTCIRERYGHRMYRYYRDSVLDSRRLHCRLIPLDIMPEDIALVNLNIYHSADELAREARYRKYLEADRDRTCQSSYEHLKLKLVTKPIRYQNDGIVLSPVVEDGMQRKLASDFSKSFCKFKKAQVDELITSINKEIEYILAFWKFFLSIKIDSFHISKSAPKEYFASYAYETQFSIAVSLNEVLIMEEMKKGKNFIQLLAKFYLLNNCKELQSALALLKENINNLAEKKVLKIMEI
jgi:glycosyltransferase involved in cell wall biosynthesis